MHTLKELGHILPCLIYAVVTAPNNQGPLLFSKLDIKNGYWQMVINPSDEWNFTNMLPKVSLDESMQLVVPSCLQMGWCKSTSYFCAASKTACNISEMLALEPVSSLPAHPLEHHLVPPKLGDRNMDCTPQALPSPDKPCSSACWKCTATILSSSPKQPTTRLNSYM